MWQLTPPTEKLGSSRPRTQARTSSCSLRHKKPILEAHASKHKGLSKARAQGLRADALQTPYIVPNHMPHHQPNLFCNMLLLMHCFNLSLSLFLSFPFSPHAPSSFTFLPTTFCPCPAGTATPCIHHLLQSFAALVYLKMLHPSLTYFNKYGMKNNSCSSNSSSSSSSSSHSHSSSSFPRTSTAPVMHCSCTA